MAEGRDAKGRFVKGHPPTFESFKPGQNVGGAPKSLTTEIKDALQLAQDALPDIIEGMIKRAKDPLDRDCQRAGEYLCDRIYGKPNQPLSGVGDHVSIATFVFVMPDGTKQTAKQLYEGAVSRN